MLSKSLGAHVLMKQEISMTSHLTKTNYKAFVGIDWANDKHDLCVQDPSTGKREFSIIKHDVNEIDKWVKGIHKRFGSPIAVAVELTKGPIVYALQRYEFVVIVPINPTTLAKYRTAFKPSKAKDDPTDAELALELMLRYPNHFPPLNQQSVNMRKLMFLVEHRRKVVDDKQRVVNQMINAIKQYYPQANEWFCKKDTHIFCDFIARWPTLQQAKKAHKSTLVKFFNDHGIHNSTIVDHRVSLIKKAKPLTDDKAVIDSHTMLVIFYIERIVNSMKCIQQYNKSILKLMDKLPDAPIFNSLPGAGAALSSRLLAAFGEQRDRFKSAKEVQQYAGIAPVTERSGQKSWVHWRWQCSTFLRQTFIEWATHSRLKSYWANLYYLQQREKGSSHQAAIRALAFKWIRIVYKCWQDGKPYNETQYLRALKDRGSPLLSDKV